MLLFKSQNKWGCEKTARVLNVQNSHGLKVFGERNCRRITKSVIQSNMGSIATGRFRHTLVPQIEAMFPSFFVNTNSSSSFTRIQNTLLCI
jgi:hypothetical protein